jgi:hypothetical protein
MKTKTQNIRKHRPTSMAGVGLKNKLIMRSSMREDTNTHCFGVAPDGFQPPIKSQSFHFWKYNVTVKKVLINVICFSPKRKVEFLFAWGGIRISPALDVINFMITSFLF